MLLREDSHRLNSMAAKIENSSFRTLRVVAALCGFAAVALGAFGAHALRSNLSALATVETWNTASLYHLVHSAVLFCIACAYPKARLSFWLIFIGIVLFSGSLYVFSLTGLKAAAALTPVGGLSFLAGWLSLAFGRSDISGK